MIKFNLNDRSIFIGENKMKIKCTKSIFLGILSLNILVAASHAGLPSRNCMLKKEMPNSELEQPVQFNVDVDILGITQLVIDKVKINSNRAGFVKNLAESLFDSFHQQYNVMVFNLNQNYEEHFQRVKFYQSTTYDGIVYGIWAFESGTFQNQGDGGYINWAFKGWFDRNGSFVQFTWPGLTSL